MSEGFGPRLRRERERRHITLATIAEQTKINTALFEGLERDDVSRWPSGIFRKAFLKSYARAIGLDPEETLREFVERFPDPIDPPAAPPAGAPAVEHPGAPSAVDADDSVLRLKLAEAGLPFSGGRFLSDARGRWAAVAWDAGVVFAIALSVFVALDTFWTPLSVSMLCYYLGGILILGNTPGVCLFAPRPADGDIDAPEAPAAAPPRPERSRTADVAFHAFKASARHARRAHVSRV
jgi:transcriptional regulator with XRE-family HTH domain